MTSAARFEARQGWVAVSPDGSVWCYRARGCAGVLVFERNDAGKVLFQATHQDCFSVDTSLTTESRRTAIRFAVTGVGGAGGAGGGVEGPAGGESPDTDANAGATASSGHAPSEPDRVVDGRLEDDAREGEWHASGRGTSGPDVLTAMSSKREILEALPGLSLDDRREVLDHLLQLESPIAG